MQSGTPIDDLFVQLEELVTPTNDRHIYTLIREWFSRRGLTVSSVDVPQYAEIMAFAFFPGHRPDEEKVWETYYGPMIIEVGGATFPDIQDVSLETIRHWEQRSTTAISPLLRERYADLVWDLSTKVGLPRPPISVAHVSIDSALQVIEQGLCDSVSRNIKRLTRAVQLSVSINDTRRIERAALRTMNYERKVAELKKPGTWGFAYDILTSHRRITLTEAQQSDLLNDLVERFNEATDHSPPLTHVMTAAHARLISAFRRSRDTAKEIEVTTCYTKAILVASEHMRLFEALQTLTRLASTLAPYGLDELSETVASSIHHLAGAASDASRTVTAKVGVKSEDLDRWVNQIVEGSLEDALMKLAATFLIRPDDLRKKVEELRESAVFFSYTRQVLLDNERGIVANIGTSDEDEDGRIIQQGVWSLYTGSQLFGQALEGLLAKFSPTPEEILQVLYLSPAFSECERPLLLHGLTRFLAKDHIAAVHVLVPRVESAIRRLLREMGYPSVRITRNGTWSARLLDDLLREELPETMPVYRDIFFHLRVVFTDQRGPNIRNEICHGLTDAEFFDTAMTGWVLHALLLLGSMQRTVVPAPKPASMGIS